MKKHILTSLVLSAVVSPAFAGGSSWGSVSNSPAEDNNVVTMLYAEQNMTAWEREGLKLKPFVDSTLTLDTKGFDWNNKVTGRAGVALEKAVGSGIVALRAGVAADHYFKSETSAANPFVSAEYWFGWGYGSSNPGSSWGMIGNLSPSEKGNVSAMVHVEQGFFAQQVDDNGKIIPFVDMTLVRDTDHYDWNNKNVLGLGVKYSRTVDTGVVDVGAKFQHETRIDSGVKEQGVVLFATYWFGW